MDIDESKLDEYVIDAKDAILFTGLAFFCSKSKQNSEFNKATYTGFTLLPSPFPKDQFTYAVEIQKHWNLLLHKCSNDLKFIYESLKRFTISFFT